MKKELLVRVTANLSHYYRSRLVDSAFKLNMPIGRLLAIALENELMKEKPFDLDLSLPTDEVEEYAYAEQASKILSYLKDLEGVGLDLLILCRHDIGVPDKTEFLYAFKECLDKNMIEGFKPKAGPFITTQYADGYLHYRLWDKNPKRIKHQERKNKRYEKLQKLKKEFKDV